MTEQLNITENLLNRVPNALTGVSASMLSPVDYLYVTVELFLFIATNFGNGMVIASFIHFPSIRRKLPHHWLLHLAIADLILGLVLPFHIFTFIKRDYIKNKYTPEGAEWICLSRYSSATISLTASLILLVLLAVHVLLSVQFPYKYKCNAWITPAKLHTSAALVWIFAVFYGVLPFRRFLYPEEARAQKFTYSCALAKVRSVDHQNKHQVR